MFSEACISELTYAADHGMKIIPVVFDFEYTAVIQSPEKYLNISEDIEGRMAKVEVMQSLLAHCLHRTAPHRTLHHPAHSSAPHRLRKAVAWL